MALSQQQIDETLRFIEEEGQRDTTIDVEGTKRDFLAQNQPKSASGQTVEREIQPDESPLTVGERFARGFADSDVGEDSAKFADYLSKKGIKNVSFDPKLRQITVAGKPIDPKGFKNPAELTKDVADAIGQSIPFVTSILAPLFGAPAVATAAAATGPAAPITAIAGEAALSGVGAAGGEAIRRGAGQMMGVRDKPIEDELKETGKSAAVSALTQGVVGGTMKAGLAVGKLALEEGVPVLVKTFQDIAPKITKNFMNPNAAGEVLDDVGLKNLTNTAVKVFDQYKKTVGDRFGRAFKRIRIETREKELVKPETVARNLQSIVGRFKDNMEQVPQEYANLVKGFAQMAKTFRERGGATLDELYKYREQMNRAIEVEAPKMSIRDSDLNILRKMAGEVDRIMQKVPAYKGLRESYSNVVRDVDLLESKVFSGDIEKKLIESNKLSDSVMGLLKRVDIKAKNAYKFLDSFEKTAANRAFSRWLPEKLPFTGLLYTLASSLAAAKINPALALFMLGLSPKMVGLGIKASSKALRVAGKKPEIVRPIVGQTAAQGVKSLEGMFIGGENE